VQVPGENRPMKKKIAKFILLAVCALAVYAAISAVLRSREEKRLKAEIADIRRTLREQGFKTELDDFKITTDPAMRARVAALTALGNAPQLNTNRDFLDIRPFISNGVAKALWKQDSLSLRTNALQWADFRVSLNKEWVRLDAACDAALQGPIRSDLDLNNHLGPWHGHLGYLPRLSLTLGYREILNLHDGQPDAAWTNLLAATRLVTAWNVEPDYTSYLVRAFMADNIYSLAWQALQFNHWPDDRLSILQSEWESTDFFTNSSEVMGLVRVEDDHDCQQLLENPPSGTYSISEIGKDLLDNPSEAFREAGKNYRAIHYRGNEVLTDEKNLLLYFRDRELELRHAIQSPTWAQMWAQTGITNPPPFESPWENTVAMVNAGSHVPFRLTAGAAVAEAERRILITAIALERYRVKNGLYPQTLASLTPEFLKAPMPDFMDGQPLRYRPTSSGHFLLYSVGPDCVDDGGKQPPPGSAAFVSSINGTNLILTHADIVWPVPAAP
jgi:hypothetical protein